MEPGECWMLHNLRDHSAINLHASEPRYHLSFDIGPVAETFALVDDAETGLGWKDPETYNRLWPSGEAQ